MSRLFIRTIYLYLFSLLGLVILVIGLIKLVDLGLKIYVFTKADQEKYVNFYANSASNLVIKPSSNDTLFNSNIVPCINNAYNSGQKYLPPSINAENADIIINGTNNFDFFGYSIANLGDINGDGYDDIVIGAYGAEDTGTERGRVYIFYGTGEPDFSLDAENADIIINGTNDGDWFGSSVSSAGDINNDGYDDIVIGAYGAEDTVYNQGRVYVIYGSSTLASSIDAENADIIINGTNNFDFFGYSVSSAGDINGDGYDDIIIGTYYAEDTGTDRGRAYVIYGSTLIATSSIDAENADIIINGTNDYDWFGYSVSSAGDINNDGYDDIIVGAYTAEDTGTDRGRAYVIYGSSTLASSIDAENADIIINGTNDYDWFGYSVSSAGDINGDGYDDIIIGAYLAGDTGSARGRAYVIYGSSTLASSIDAENADIIINGTNDSDYFGYSVSDAGDINNDGYNDIIIGAYTAEDTGTDRGRAYVIYGSSTLASSIDAENADIIINGTNDYDHFGNSVSSAGDINGDCYDDIIIGTYTAEDTGTDRGCAYVIYGGRQK